MHHWQKAIQPEKCTDPNKLAVHFRVNFLAVPRPAPEMPGKKGTEKEKEGAAKGFKPKLNSNDRLFIKAAQDAAPSPSKDDEDPLPPNAHKHTRTLYESRTQLNLIQACV